MASLNAYHIMPFTLSYLFPSEHLAGDFIEKVETRAPESKIVTWQIIAEGYMAELVEEPGTNVEVTFENPLYESVIILIDDKHLVSRVASDVC